MDRRDIGMMNDGMWQREGAGRAVGDGVKDDGLKSRRLEGLAFRVTWCAQRTGHTPQYVSESDVS